jgi:3-methyladenine DNA glycosylase AlkC
MSALKDLYSPAFYNQLSACLTATVPGFDAKLFTERIFTADFEQKELKERMKHTTAVLHTFFPADYPAAIDLLIKIIARIRQDFRQGGLEFIFFPDYIATYGLADYETSVRAMESVTQFITCEFGIRPFIVKYYDRMLQQMENWSLHENEHVRRLASEGSRPLLPWGMGVPALKKDPQVNLQLLDNLKNDPSESVRRSVANHLNDLAKNHPQTVIEIARKWQGFSPETDAVIRHGLRTLLKQSHPEILQFYGLDSAGLEFSAFTVHTPTVAIGDSLEFSFQLENTGPARTIRLEYAIYYKRQQDNVSRKVFKISEKTYRSGEKIEVMRRQSFRPITTRRFYAGIQQVSILINGAEQVPADFELLGDS